MKIPKQIKVGGFTYKIERPEGSFVSDDGTALDGEHSFSEKTIRVGTSGCEEYQGIVFLHEVCHAIIECYIGPEEHDEKFVEQFSKGLYQVLVDNEEIMKGGVDGDKTE